MPHIPNKTFYSGEAKYLKTVINTAFALFTSDTLLQFLISQTSDILIASVTSSKRIYSGVRYETRVFIKL